VTATRTLAGGRSHTTYLARGLRTGRVAVVKTGGDPARICREARALTALGAIPGLPAARLLGAPGQCSQPRLILDYIPGRHPRSLADYQAFGAALAVLHATPVTGPMRGLEQTPAQLLAPAAALAAAVAPDLAGVIGAVAPAPGQPWAGTVLIHGDAAPANVLIDRRGDAVLIDFENTTLAHPGLDVGRAIFLTGMTPAPAPLRCARVDAILSGYARHRTLPADLGCWAAAVGLHIAAWRYARAGSAPSWRTAVAHARTAAQGRAGLP
jgi:aminoglycoside phosphotransferase (APT) family kinase protein